MKTALLIFVGGGLGSVARYFLGTRLSKAFVDPITQVSTFPVGTLTVNVIACFLVGILAGLGGQRDPAARALLIIGFCGGFSTFSTFTIETTGLEPSMALLYIAASVLGCLAATFFGLWISGRA